MDILDEVSGKSIGSESNRRRFAAPASDLLSLPFSMPAGEEAALQNAVPVAQPASPPSQAEGGSPRLGQVTLRNAARANAVRKNDGKTHLIIKKLGNW